MRGKEDRQRAQEAKYAQDQENTFRHMLNRARSAGGWVAEVLGQTDEEASKTGVDYANAYLTGGLTALTERAVTDLSDKMSESEIDERISRILAGEV